MILEAKFLGCLLGAAVGDALGANFEGLPRIETGWIEVEGLLRYTDDTEMTIGVAESLIANRGFNGEHMAWTFIKNYDPSRGYGPGPPRVFRWIRSGVSWREAARRLYGGMGSFGNGAAMRIAPVALLYYDDDEKLRETATAVSEITHTHPLGIEGAVLQAYSIAQALKTEPNKLEPTEFVEKLQQFTESPVYLEKLKTMKRLLASEAPRIQVIRELGHSVEAFNSVPTAIYSFLKNHKNFAEAILYAISLGGDTDTIASMTGANAGAHKGVEAIPETWLKNLENRDYIQKLAQKLWEVKQEQTLK